MTTTQEEPRANTTHELVTRFNKSMSSLVAKALKAEEHTNTLGWQDIYRRHRESDEKKRLAHSEELMGFAELLLDPVEIRTAKDLKELADIKKDLVEHFTYCDTFAREVLGPIKGLAEMADTLRKKAIEDANELEEMAGLSNQGVSAEVAEAIDASPVIAWNNETGVLSVHTKQTPEE